MKRLLLDLGNSRLKWRLIDAGVVGEGALEHAAIGAGDGLTSLLERAAGASTWLASVADKSTTATLAERLRAGGLESPARVRVRPKLGGLEIAYREPSQLGVDRWLAMLGVLDAIAGARVVALAGTACTLDAVDPDGHHLGGLIVPGLGAQHAALTRGPLHLADDRQGAPVLFADATAKAVASGPPWALASLIERFADETERVTGSAATVIVGGGDGARVHALLARRARLCPNPVLDGLARFAEVSPQIPD